MTMLQALPQAIAPVPVRSDPQPRADINRIERLLKDGGWDFRFDPVAEHSYYTKLGSRIQIQGSGYATPNWTIYFNALPVTPAELCAMCAKQDTAYWHLPKLEAGLAECVAAGWRVTKEPRHPLKWQVHGRVSVELYLWGDELCFYTYTADDAGREHTLSLLDGTSPKDMAETIMDAE